MCVCLHTSDLCVCRCVCVSVSVCVYLHICVDVCVYFCTCVFVCVFAFLHVFVFACVCIHLDVHFCVLFELTCVSLHVCTGHLPTVSSHPPFSFLIQCVCVCVCVCAHFWYVCIMVCVGVLASAYLCVVTRVHRSFTFWKYAVVLLFGRSILTSPMGPRPAQLSPGSVWLRQE